MKSFDKTQRYRKWIKFNKGKKRDFELTKICSIYFYEIIDKFKTERKESLKELTKKKRTEQRKYHKIYGIHHCVYGIYHDDKLIYVGSTDNLDVRQKGEYNKNVEKYMNENICEFKIIQKGFRTLQERLIVEQIYIYKFISEGQKLFNIQKYKIM